MSILTRRIALSVAMAVAITLSVDVGAQPVDVPPVSPPVNPPPIAPPPVIAPLAAGDTMVYQEYGKRMQAAGEVAPLSSDLFGENVSLLNGQTSFSVVDVDIPGNSTLPVQVRRTFDLQRLAEEDPYGGLGTWDIDVPHIVGTFPGIGKWDLSPSTTTPGTLTSAPRCTAPFQPNATFPLNETDYHSGVTVHLPGQGSKLLYGLNHSIHPSSGGPYYWTTPDFDAISCTTATANGYPGQGFKLTTAQGVTYTFDQGFERNASRIVSNRGSDIGSRVRVYLLASKVEDRFGNTVNYFYNANGHPTTITGKSADNGDVRTISLVYGAGSGARERLTSVSAHGRTWSYSYTFVDERDQLTEVTRPDTSEKWIYTYTGSRRISPQVWDGNKSPNCTGAPEDSASFGMTVRHPAGATGVFEFTYQRHWRSGVPLSNCEISFPPPGIANIRMLKPNFSDNFSLVRKTISGPGITDPADPTLPATQEWFYDYHANSPPSQGYGMCAPGNCSSVPLSKVVQVWQRGVGKTCHTFGVKWDVNNGQLLGTETRASTDPNCGIVMNSPLEKTINTYVDDASMGSMPFPNLYGMGNYIDPDVSQKIRPLKSAAITRQDVTFTSNTSTFDGYARPVSTTKSSTLSATLAPNSRTEVTTYHDNTAKWILGQVASITAAGLTPPLESNTYDPTTALRLTHSQNGNLQHTLTWRPDGNVATVKDGGHNTTWVGDDLGYSRGVPLKIRYADGKFQTALVDGFGQIEGVTDELGNQTHYDYYAHGRLERIRYPTLDTVTWNSKEFQLQWINSAEAGIAAGHWRQTVTQGNATTVTYFDALLRPAMKTTYDSLDMAGTQRTVVTRFDYANRVIFTSYPKRMIAAIGASVYGVMSAYDALGRLSQTQASSEHGPLTTNTAYLTNFQKQVTNPRGYATTTSYQALGMPGEDTPVTIVEPGAAAGDTVTTTTTRNLLGQPLVLKRSGNYQGSSVSAMRTYVYDDNRRLCKTMEPESESTVIYYDAAGNVKWKAAGLVLTDPADCQQTIGAGGIDPNRITTFGYDTRNRLTDTTYGDGSPLIHTIYTPDGLPKTVTSDGSVWEYTYNRRRLLETETLTSGSNVYLTGHTYTPNGHPASISYPGGGPTVDYAPNALGEQTRAGSYATNVTRHPNGAIHTFRYGNNIVHTTTQTDRGLPDLSSDASTSVNVLNDDYDWDANGNVSQILSGIAARGSRTMSYDPRDRLEGASLVKPGVGVPASFTFSYDALDNLRTYNTPFRPYTHQYDPRTNRLMRIYAPGNATVYQYGYAGEAGDRGTITQRNHPTSAQTFAFDQGNRMRSLTGTASASYRYDGLGRRTESLDAAVQSLTTYSQSGKLLLDHRKNLAAGALKKGNRTFYIYLGNHLVAKERVPIGQTAGTLTYLHTDGLGSPVAETSASGAVISRTAHEPYGFEVDTMPAQGPGYTGHVVDAATGLSYMQQRYYDPLAGRFLSMDPVAADANTGANFNRYWYANNNPYKFVDPDGRISYLASRPLDFAAVGKIANHNFIVHDASRPGDPAASVRSFGITSDGTVGEVTASTTGPNANTSKMDAAAWKSVGGQDSKTTFRVIDASDSTVKANADSVTSGSDYSYVPELAGGFNSNTVAAAVAQESDGGSPRVGNGKFQGGTSDERVSAARQQVLSKPKKEL